MGKGRDERNAAKRQELLEAVADEANRFLDLNWGYLDEPTREALEPLVKAVELIPDA